MAEYLVATDSGSEISAISKFVEFCSNFPSPKEMCEKIWGHGWVAEHFYDKMKLCDFDMCTFFTELDSSNRKLFGNFILNGYKL